MEEEGGRMRKKIMKNGRRMKKMIRKNEEAIGVLGF